MTKRYGQIIGWGAYTPNTTVTNDMLAQQVETSHEWIVQRTGIHQRHFAQEGEDGVTMAVAAAQRALAQANLQATDLNLIIAATCLIDVLTPSVSTRVQYQIGARHIPAFDLNAGCSGFVYALSVAYQFLESGVYDNILIIGTEHISRFIDWEDRNTAVLFGDGAAALIIQATDQPCGLHGFDLGADGSQSHELACALTDMIASEGHTKASITMNGRAVFRFASRIMKPASQAVLEQAGMTLNDIDWIIPHQANLRIIQSAARHMDVALDRFYINIDHVANTSAASIPLALVEGLTEGIIQPTDTILMIAFGAGLTWGAGILQLAPKQPLPPLPAMNGQRKTAVLPT